jgi:anti-anti-sigma factor
VRHGLHVDQRPDRHGLVLTVRGELDLEAVPVLLAQVRAALRRRPPRLRLDLSAVTFAQAAAVAGLVDVRHAAVAAGIELDVVTGDGVLRRLLALSGQEAAVHGRAARGRLRERAVPARVAMAPPDPAAGEVVVRLEGELDVAATAALEARLARLRRGRRDVVVDLRRLTFCDAAGLAALVRATQAARADGLGLATTPASGAVHRLIELTGVARLLAAAPAT